MWFILGSTFLLDKMNYIKKFDSDSSNFGFLVVWQGLNFF